MLASGKRPAERYRSGGQIAAELLDNQIHLLIYVVHLAVGDALSEMPLFLEPGQAVHVPPERAYQAAFDAVP